MKINDIGATPGVADLSVQQLELHTGPGRLKAAWRQFVTSGHLDESGVRPLIAASWLRCGALGLDPHAPPSTGVSRPGAAVIELREILANAARPFMTEIRDFLQEAEFSIAVLDSAGTVLDVVGRDVIGRTAPRVHFHPGDLWREDTVGTTAIGLALRERKPVQVVAEEHFNRHFHDLACSAAPVWTPSGELAGVLNVAGERGAVQPHTLGMVVAAAKAITNQLAAAEATQKLTMSHRLKLAILDAISDGLITLDSRGYIMHMNASAGRLLGIDPVAAIGKHVEEIVDFRPVILDVLRSGEGYVDREFFLSGKTTSFHFIKTAIPITDDAGHVTAVVDAFREAKRVRRMVNQMTGAHANFTFADFVGRSPVLTDTLRLARIAGRSSSTLLIQGESGTGKEILAQAIHNASDRREGPFIAINCAAMPRELIESELFGHEEGAFTGARRGGRPGKFELANGGTLFLDEIGDLPFDMQAKLLRAIQEQRVMRLGGQNYIAIDARLIAATNKDLSREVEDGNFRKDLYYRLNVLFVEVPPLRQRAEDIPLLVSHILGRLSAKLGRRVESVGDEVLDVFRRHAWPGNVRELENVLERAANVAEDPEIAARDLPKYLRDLVLERAGSGAGGSQADVTAVLADAAVAAGAAVLPMDEVEKAAISRALAAFGGNVSQTAAALRLSRNTLYSKMQRFGLVRKPLLNS